MEYRKTIEGQVGVRIARKKATVFLREDFIDIGGYDQVGRALRALIQKGKLIKIGYGLYAKTKVSKLTGRQVPAEPLPVLARKALKRLGVKVAPAKADREYEQGSSTQVPTGRLIGVNKRVSRKISYKDALINYERNSK
jgi:hypothetical protein